MITADDFLYFMLAMLFAKQPTIYERLDITMTGMTTKEIFEKVICDRIQNPTASAEDIRTLSEAFANLHKDEWMKTLSMMNGYGIGFNGPTNSTEQAQLVAIKVDEKG